MTDAELLVRTSKLSPAERIHNELRWQFGVATWWLAIAVTLAISVGNMIR